MIWPPGTNCKQQFTAAHERTPCRASAPAMHYDTFLNELTLWDSFFQGSSTDWWSHPLQTPTGFVCILLQLSLKQAHRFESKFTAEISTNPIEGSALCVCSRASRLCYWILSGTTLGRGIASLSQGKPPPATMPYARQWHLYDPTSNVQHN